MNALKSNVYTEAWRFIGRSIPKPKAILCISAHWYLSGTYITGQERPETIHDFGGFPPELYRVLYPAPGEPSLAQHVQQILLPVPVHLDYQWGLDHGTWSVLCHLFPRADIPVVQLSINKTQPPGFHYALGKMLSALRDEGILIIGSGNVIHNLHAYSWGHHPVEPLDWAVRFEHQARELMNAGDHAPLIDYETMGPDALLSVPTPDHYLPLLYVLALQQNDEPISFPVEGFDGGSVSMLSVRIG